MALNKQPVLKRCKSLGISPSTMGITKETNRNPKQGRKKQSEYGLQLNEKQKVKFIYGVLEKQFYGYYEKAARMNGMTGECLMQLLERRLDNTVYRLGFAKTRREARQLVNHGHFTVNGKKVDIPSYLISVGDVVAIKEKSQASEKFKALIEANHAMVLPSWLKKENGACEGSVINLPQRSDIDFELHENLIVEFYSR